MAGNRETAIQREILAAVSRLPHTVVWRNESGAVRGKDNPERVFRIGVPGSPDIIGVHEGRAIGIEVKGPRGRQSKQQRRFQDAWEAAGGIYVVARSVDEALQGIGEVQQS